VNVDRQDATIFGLFIYLLLISSSFNNLNKFRNCKPFIVLSDFLTLDLKHSEHVAVYW